MCRWCREAIIKEEEPVVTRMMIRRLEGAQLENPRGVSWTDALDEEQQAREMNYDDG